MLEEQAMTITEIRQLSDDALRLEIAKALGWRQEDNGDGGLMWVAPPDTIPWGFPDWPHSLDACGFLRRDIERRAKTDKYRIWLWKITRRYVDILHPEWRRINATARQHSEAALMAMQEETDAK
jgi:hypothetical protein